MSVPRTYSKCHIYPVVIVNYSDFEVLSLLFVNLNYDGSVAPNILFIFIHLESWLKYLIWQFLGLSVWVTSIVLLTFSEY